ncbi:MAG: ATP-binding cassette domain-containing protein [Armatimonadetes bacterium]|nr:ATP-binding cassette domain-containing protein [Armatimonadota bacterium]
MGENGAGKSTLMHVLGGVYQPDSGRIRVNGEEVRLADPHDASRRGIGVVFQELSLSENLSIAENIFANRQPILYAGLIDWWELYAHAEDVLRLFDWDIDPRTPVAELSTARRQVVEILKAIAGEPNVLILDEPTSSLTAAETEMLFKNIGRLKAEGQSMRVSPGPGAPNSLGPYSAWRPCTAGGCSSTAGRSPFAARRKPSRPGSRT